MRIVQKVAQLTPVEEIIGGHFENTIIGGVKKVFDDGSIRVF